jgi:O-antigen/teichoic acid export membrane protein
MSLILTGFILYGKSFIVFWVGKDFEKVYYMSLIVMIPLLIPLIENMGIMVLQAKNKHAFRSKIYFIIAILNIILTIPLAKLYGGIGCAIATSAALFIGNVVIINIYYHKKIGIDIIAFIKEILSMTLSVIISLTIGVTINYFIETSSIIILVFKIIFYLFVFISLMWFMAFNNYEKNIFIGMVNKIKSNRLSI